MANPRFCHCLICITTVHWSLKSEGGKPYPMCSSAPFPLLSGGITSGGRQWTQSCLTLSLSINETLKWLSSLPILMQESFWWWQCSDRYILSLFPHLHTPSPVSPSLISLMVSVEVKHHVYQRASTHTSVQLPCHVSFLPDSEKIS